MSRCGYQYKLSRIDKMPEQPGVAQCVGKAFHRWSEHADAGDFDNDTDHADSWQTILAEEVEQQLADTGVAPTEWRVSGRRTKANPDGETLEYWGFAGVDMCDKYMAWRASRDLVIATDLPPDENGNTTGIEYAVKVKLPSGVELVGYIDRVMVRPSDGARGALDLKAGTQVRKTVQLGFYSAGAAVLGVDLKWGAFYSARKGELYPPQSLAAWTPGQVDELLAVPNKLRELNVFPPAPGEHCSFCGVRDYCKFWL